MLRQVCVSLKLARGDYSGEEGDSKIEIFQSRDGLVDSEPRSTDTIRDFGDISHTQTQHMQWGRDVVVAVVVVNQK